MTVEEFLDTGELRDAHDPRIRASMASALALLIQLTEPFRSDRALLAATRTHRDPGALWPKPHNALFDFAIRSQDSPWIEEFAAEALQIVTTFKGPKVVGHGDWSAKHFRFRNDEITAVYDWDSLALAPEPVILGVAAATFTYHEELKVPRAPTKHELEAFIHDYSDARFKPLSSEEVQIARAQAVYSMAYGAKCEVSFVGEREGEEPTYWRDALSSFGRRLLQKAEL